MNYTLHKRICKQQRQHIVTFLNPIETRGRGGLKGKGKSIESDIVPFRIASYNQLKNNGHGMEGEGREWKGIE